ncbi:MAG TPA: Cof-type HAD-IIB family hydrolase [Chondromyces sp.]|nr:Cof-type HAD-IIB family hydrolase [Chondromyces sp.]
MNKIVFFDIDGTLLNHEKKLPDKTKEAIRLLQQNGVYTAIATGRAPFMFEGLREELGIDSFVSFNGQYVVFEGEVLYTNPLERDALEKVVRDSQEKKNPLVFMSEKTMKANVQHHPYIEESLRTLKFPHPEKKEDYFQTNELYQTLLFCTEEEEEFYIKNFPEFTFIRWHEYSVDILPSGGSKAEGIKKMIQRLGFQMKDVYAFGDGLNDIEMLEAVGTGVAMGNALPIVKEHADLVTADAAEDGIYKGLKKLELI